MQTNETKQFTNVLYAELSTPKRLVWEYQTADSATWNEADSSDLLFRLIPSGIVAAYRVKVSAQ